MYIKHRTLQMVHEIEKIQHKKKLQDNCLEVNECRGEKIKNPSVINTFKPVG